MAKHACSATFLQSVQNAKGKRLPCKRGNIWIMYVKLASSGKVMELSQRFKGMARLVCLNLHYPLQLWYYMDNLSSGTREEVSRLLLHPQQACCSAAMEQDTALFLHRRSDRNPRSQDKSWWRWGLYDSRRITGMEKYSAAHSAISFASGWRSQVADAGLPIKPEQLRSQGQGKWWKKRFSSLWSSIISQN